MRLVNKIVQVFNGPEFIPNIVSNVIAGLILLLVPFAFVFFLGCFSNVPAEETWRNKVWTEKISESVSVYSSTDSPNRVDITGMIEGPLKIEIVEESETELSGVLKCLDHGKTVGWCIVKFMPKNQLRVSATGDNNYGFDLVFVCRSKHETQEVRGTFAKSDNGTAN